MSTVVVTGAAGFIGSHLCERLAHDGFQVRAVDCLLPDSYSRAIKTANWHSLASLPGVERYQVDLGQRVPRELLDGATAVVNEAGMPGLTKSWDNLGLYLRNNVAVVGNLAQACVEADVKHFVQVSTSSIYGKRAVGREDVEPAPVSPYGVTKLAGEELIHAYGRTHGLRYTILRYFSVYGPRQRPDMAYNIFIRALLSGERIVIYGDGNQTRTNTYVSDICAGTCAALSTEGQGETYNLAGGQEYSLLEIVQILEDLTGAKANVEFHPARIGDQAATRGDFTKAAKMFGYNPRVDLTEGLLRQVEWQRSLDYPRG